MNKKFNLYESDGFWAIIETEITDKLSSMKAYGADTVVKRLNELYEEVERWKAHKEFDRQINLEQSRKIEQLEEKLEEKEFELKELHSAYRDLEKIVDDNYEEFEKRFAKKQKEETIKTLERMLDDLRRE